MRILHVTSEGRGSLAGRTVRWLGMEFTVAGFQPDDLVRYEGASPGRAAVVRAVLDRAVAEAERFDGVYAEAPEALLLHYVRARRGLRPLRWLVNVVSLLDRVTPLRELVRRAYGEDPLALMAADPEVRWYVTTRAHLEPLVAAGLPRERLAFFPANAAMALILPGAAEALAGAHGHPLPEALRGVAGALLLAGVNSRDVTTTARAAALAEVPVQVLTDLARVPAVASPRLTFHGLAPLPDFLAAIVACRAVVLALQPVAGSCGQQTIAFAQHLGALVVASDVPAVRDYLVDGESGVLVPPGDAAALAVALRLALDHPRRSALVEAGRRRCARDDRLVEGFFLEAFADAGPRPSPGRSRLPAGTPSA